MVSPAPVSLLSADLCLRKTPTLTRTLCNTIGRSRKHKQRTSVAPQKAKSSPLGDSDHGHTGIWMGKSFPTRPNND